MTRTIPFLVIPLRDEAAAILVHRHAVYFQVRPGYFFASSRNNFIVALLPTAAIVPGYEEIIVFILLKNERCFNRSVAGQRIGETKIPRPASDSIPFLRLC